ncbi:hypothetical protein, partial [Corynebacterium sp. HMSC036E10]
VVEDAAKRWRLRFTLLKFQGRFDALSRYADQVIDAKKPAPEKQVRFSRAREGMATLHLTHSARNIADIEHTLRG